MNYEINEETLAILPVDGTKSKIIELNQEYIIDDNPYQVMEHSCEYFGSSLNGRLVGSKNMLGSIYKVPVLVEESRNLIFFPTQSPILEDNSWISLNKIVNYKKVDDKTMITFKNDKNLIVDIPFLSIQNQIYRATRLESVLRNRKNTIKND